MSLLVLSRPQLRARSKRRVSKEAKVWEKKEAELAKYVPYIPPSLLAETVKFLDNKANIRALLEIIGAPMKPQETSEQREEYTRRLEYYNEQKRLFNRPYRDQEKLAELSLWRAINSLPSDLYPEAVAESKVPPPLELFPHYLYRSQILKTLSDYEERQLQVFQNLMYLRFPFNEIKKKNPGLFWITQLGQINRARIAKLSKAIVYWRH